jgi:hypothetical protein
MTAIEICDDAAAILQAEATEQGLTLTALIERIATEMAISRSRGPLTIPRNLLAQFGPAPTSEEISENSGPASGAA